MVRPTASLQPPASARNRRPLHEAAHMASQPLSRGEGHDVADSILPSTSPTTVINTSSGTPMLLQVEPDITNEYTAPPSARGWRCNRSLAQRSRAFCATAYAGR